MVLYPQTAVTDKKVAENITKYGTQFRDTDWYYYDGNFYIQSRAYVSEGDRFADGTLVEAYKFYWFKCEPIQWKILSSNNGEHYVLSNYVLDSRIYFGQITGTRLIDDVYVKPNNYEYSELRSFLIETVSSRAFLLGSNYAKITNVDNSSASTADSGTNNNACKNTNDRMFLPSKQDMLTGAYGFSTDTSDSSTRLARYTDWALATGFQMVANGYADYWTRSPSGKYMDAAFIVDTDGGIPTTNINAPHGIRPAITLLEEPIK